MEPRGPGVGVDEQEHTAGGDRTVTVRDVRPTAQEC